MCGFSLHAQTVTVTDNSNAAISPSAVVGDSLQVTITGAAASSLVTLTYTQNGTPGTYFAGYTDAMGSFTQTDPNVASWKIGAWTEQWDVGGVNVGPNFSLEVFDAPSSLSVQSVAATSPDACGSSYQNFGTKPYGPSASIQYQINGANGSVTVPNTGLGIMLEPQESVGGGAVGDLGCTTGCPTGWLWTPPSAKYASSSGRFYDVPVADCLAVAFSNTPSPVQNISIKIGNHNYPVRSQYFTSSSSSPGHGSTTSSYGDVSYSQ